MSDGIRVRFAPSPTGMFHVGTARSALFNWALARQGHGRFVLRIEDTDAERNRPEWVEGIISALAAIGISGDDPAFERPYFQSHSAGVQRSTCCGCSTTSMPPG
jgi:glutamyl-tRNA synthetase